MMIESDNFYLEAESFYELQIFNSCLFCVRVRNNLSVVSKGDNRQFIITLIFS